VIGIVGGGQLGRMSAMAAARLGFLVHVFDPAPGGPAAQVCAFETVAAFDDLRALRKFAQAVDVVTFEFENVPAEGLAALESVKPVRPGANVLRISQDRVLEKTFLNGIGVPTAPWVAVDVAPWLAAAVARLGVPCVLKTTRLGYDGKGQAVIRDSGEAAGAFERLAPKPLVLEAFVDFACEISVVVARGVDGAVVAFDPVENRHKNHILDMTLAPAPLPAEILTEATRLARLVADKLELVGVLAVEMFVTAAGGLLVNEIAPRPHNSGHWTIDACPASQFDMHIRAVAGLLLPPAVRHADAVMKNLVGPEGMADWEAVMATPGLIAHHYGKALARPGRKMGHFTKLFPKGGLPGAFGVADALQLRRD
jgi:5-(carboxyamino)imidazole ribonucleotide synthase